MPVFDWKCSVCEHQWEELVKMDEEPERCPMDKDLVRVSVDTNKTNLSDIEIKQTMHINDEFPEVGKTRSYEIKKLPSLFGCHLSWSSWRSL